MIAWLLAAQLVTLQIVSSHPPLAPADAARVMSRLDSITNRTNAPAPIVLMPNTIWLTAPKPAPAPAPTVVFRPLNCCDKYETPLPHPQIDVRILNGGTH